MAKEITCFLIDDDFDDQQHFETALNNTTKIKNDLVFKCIMADMGTEALIKLNGDASFIPDYIFLDLNMPRMSGKECLVEIKKIERLNAVPVIIYSTSSDPKDIEETKQMGASSFLIKPQNLNVLTEALSEYFINGKSYLFF